MLAIAAASGYLLTSEVIEKHYRAYYWLILSKHRRYHRYLIEAAVVALLNLCACVHTRHMYTQNQIKYRLF